jgi:hypothetical protein
MASRTITGHRLREDGGLIGMAVGSDGVMGFERLQATEGGPAA